MKKYRFILSPLNSIFFGDEKSPFKQEYFQRSRFMPQQTGALGFVRYQLLRISDKLGKEFEKWPELIGDSSFNGHPKQTFGKIKSIGPVGILQKNDKKVLYPYRHPAGLGSNAVDVKVCYESSSAIHDKLILFQSASKRYDPKEDSHFSHAYSNFNDTLIKAECDVDINILNSMQLNVPQKDSGVFWWDVRPGITKNYSGVPDTEGYYKTAFLRMQPRFAYTFTADIELDEEQQKKLMQSTVVHFGGDRSLFKMNVEVINDEESSQDGLFFILKSDAITDNTLFESCDSVVSDVRHFRNLQTRSSEMENFYNKRPGYKINQFKASMLLAAGSILLAKDNSSATEIVTKLSSHDPFRNIGFNAFQRLNTLPNL